MQDFFILPEGEDLTATETLLIFAFCYLAVSHMQLCVVALFIQQIWPCHYSVRK